MLLSPSPLEAQASGALGGFIAQTLQMCCGLACFSESAAGWLELHREHPKNRQQESQHREQRFPGGSSWLTRGGSFDPPLEFTVLC